jgi:1,4-dihydroxy-6-naphthoate synthase
MRPIRLAFSPDSDDLFMFWPLLAGKVDADGLVFEAERADTDSLNARAGRGDADVIAVSIARWPTIADRYLLLPHGMSVGRGYGPVVVVPRGPQAPRQCALASLAGARIAVPGLTTTAFFVLKMRLARFEPVVVPITPARRVFDALAAGEVDAALLIHEGRLTYEREGLARVCDLGEEWADATGGLPLPLGGNAIRRDLGPAVVARVSELCRASIAWALEHRDEVLRALLERGEQVSEAEPLTLDPSTLDRYLRMYANADTLDAPSDVRRAIDEFYARAYAAGLLDRGSVAEFAP